MASEESPASDRERDRATAERLLTPRATVSCHFRQPVAQISAPFGIAPTGELKPRRSHCVRATHVDHPAFRDICIDTSTIYRDRSGNNSEAVAESMLGGSSGR